MWINEWIRHQTKFKNQGIKTQPFFQLVAKRHTLCKLITFDYSPMTCNLGHAKEVNNLPSCSSQNVGAGSDVRYGTGLLVSRVCAFARAEDDSQVGRVCSRSRGVLSAGPLSPLRSAPVSYPVSSGTGNESKCFRGDSNPFRVSTKLFLYAHVRALERQNGFKPRCMLYY